MQKCLNFCQFHSVRIYIANADPGGRSMRILNTYNGNFSLTPLLTDFYVITHKPKATLLQSRHMWPRNSGWSSGPLEMFEKWKECNVWTFIGQ
jgi:hypothetical protein